MQPADDFLDIKTGACSRIAGDGDDCVALLVNMSAGCLKLKGGGGLPARISMGRSSHQPAQRARAVARVPYSLAVVMSVVS